MLDTREMAASEERGMVDVQSSRAIAEVQASMAIAKRFPRDEKVAYAKVMQACSRRTLAEVAVYQYPRGGEKVTGPSIRLAEAIAQCWGNIATGVVELERRSGESTAMAYCVDLETNYRKDVVFAVPHIRDTKQGGKALTDTRDIYELLMNMGSRRLRNCIMAVVPGDIFDAAEAKCTETLTKDEIPIQDRIREMLAAFGEYGVTGELIAAKYGQKVDSLSPQQLAKLRGIYQSLKDGVGSVRDFFDVAPAEPSRTEKLNQEAATAKPAPAAKPSPQPAVTPQVLPKAPAADPESFANFTGSLFSAPPAAETIEQVQVEVAGLIKQLQIPGAVFVARVNQMFKKAPQDLTLDECKKLRDAYRGDLAKGAVK